MATIIQGDSWITGGLPALNVATICQVTDALGPGRRAVIWVQGCPLSCPGCVSPDWIPFVMARLIRPEDAALELLSHPEVTGLTFSGGEPMMQAAGLAALARYARRQRDISIICFTGSTLEYLQTRSKWPGVADLLSEIDVLIDGPYIAEQNDNQGLRGSSNQRVHYLSDRLKDSGFDFEGNARKAEIRIRDGDALMVGVPPHGLIERFHSAVAHATHSLQRSSPEDPGQSDRPGTTEPK